MRGAERSARKRLPGAMERLQTTVRALGLVIDGDEDSHEAQQALITVVHEVTSLLAIIDAARHERRAEKIRADWKEEDNGA